jgi:Cytochrome c, mono- and diheme variants
VQGPGHCNECHAARNALGATAAGAELSGGEIPAQDWYAPDLSTQRHGGLAGWSAQDIVDLLKSGQSSHGVAFGPMADVVAASTQHISDADLQAVASYLQSLPPRPLPTPGATAAPDETVVRQGEKIYRQHCASCHGGEGTGVAGVYPPLSGNTALTDPTGINAIRAVLLGGFAPLTRANPRPYSMPPFAQQLSDSEVAAVVSYMRQAWRNHAGAVTATQVGRYRHTPVD